ncbi:H-2 class II histocompatibility antigen, E-S beta chain isoform X2 [Danio rerio]|uniref:H-2 class II histocompatibility antigen, E-S beta chain isoform X2 n=1 Tax=Danio rerio TaxID=7955 RepID=A0A8M1RH77_DANRE|nr:H-2 class II histocompatibility antigen, E-S beta chain isoform X2 [Danio rerio]|eukprot:XP_002661942.3 H-2 class II histocompatibility antigen, E-S beta chain isoform X2 [Danio rerio]
MSPANLLLMLSVFTGADGYYFSTWSQCIYSYPDLSDMVFILSFNFNKWMFLQFNSTVGIFVGYTEQGVKFAENFNKNEAYLQQLRAEVDIFCRHNAEIYESAVFDKAVMPKVNLSLVQKGDSRHPYLLRCSAYDFYPQQIKMSWLRDGRVVSDVTSSEQMPNGDWYYQSHSELVFSPKSGETISCMVEHSSLTGPVVIDWKPPVHEFEWDFQLLSAAGDASAVLGIIIATAGYIYYKTKTEKNLVAIY